MSHVTTETPDEIDFVFAGNASQQLTDICHAANRTWWTDLKTGEDLTSAPGQPLKVNIPEKLMLIVSEVAEAMEGHRKNLNDDKLPHRKMLEVELADAVIRIFDLAGGVGLDVAGALREKLAFNAKRADHKPENRRAEGGKAY
jgi:NTP pyrophosphatase (non-canonical NTP hydrolase)